MRIRLELVVEEDVRIYLKNSTYWPLTKEMLNDNPILKSVVYQAIKDELRETEDLLETLCL